MLPSPDPELAVASGLFSTCQARECGHSSEDIRRMIRRGRWSRLGRGVLLENGRAVTPEDGVRVALLTAGPLATLSHRSAAAVFGWDLLRPPDKAELTCPNVPARFDARVFRRTLTAQDVQVAGLIRVTTPVRTARDIAGTYPLVEAVVALDGAYRRGHLTPAAMKAALPTPRSWDAGPVRAVLQSSCAASGSVPETEFRMLVAAGGLPAPVPQFVITVDGLFLARVDFAWPEFRLVVEVDGYRWHSGREAHQRDRQRQRDLTKAGWIYFSFTVEDIRDRPEKVLADLRDVLG